MLYTTKTFKYYAQFGLGLLLVAYWVFSQAVPSQEGYTAIFSNNQLYDSEASYSLNSLGALNGYTYTYIHHPGMPLLEIGKVIYWLTSPFVATTGQDFTLFHLENQWLFLFLARLFLLITSVTCLLILMRFSIPITTNTDVLVAAAIGIVYFAFFSRSFSFMRLWSHGSFAFPCGTSLLFVTYILVQRTKQLPRRYLWLLGFLAGILTSTQLYFATWVVAIIAIVMLSSIFERRVLWRGFVDAFQVGIASLLGFGFALLPAIENFHVFYDWLMSLVFHQGIYGSGAEGIISPDSISTNLALLFTDEPLISTVTVLVIFAIPILIFLQRSEIQRKPKLYALLLGFYIQLIVTIALILKHASGAYMVAIAAILPMLLLTCYEATKDLKHGYRLMRYLCFIILVAAIFNFVNALIAHKSYLDNVDNRLHDYQVAINKLGMDEDNEIIVLTGYRSLPSLCEYLWFGNEWSGRVFSNEISQICPTQFYFDSLEKAIRLPDSPTTQITNTQFPWDVLILDDLDFRLTGGYGIRVYAGSDLHFFVNPTRLASFDLTELWLDFNYIYGNSSRWHNPESLSSGVSVQWMSDTSSTLTLNLAASESDYVVTFRVFSVGENNLDELQLSVNGEDIELEYDENAVYTGLIPHSILNIDGGEVFTFTVSQTINLMDAGYNDNRIVGVGFDWLEIREDW